MENEKVIDIDEGNIKFSARQYFAEPNQPRLWDVLINLKIANPSNYKLLILMKRIAEKLKSEGAIIDSAIKDIQEPYIVEGEPPKFGTPEFVELDRKLGELLETVIEFPYPKIKLSQVTGIRSLAELEAVNGIVEIDIDEPDV